VAFGPSASLCFLSLAASQDGCRASVAGAGAAGRRGAGAYAGLALGVNVDGGLAPVGGDRAPVVGRPAGLAAGTAVAPALLPYALAMLPSVACSLAF